METMQIHNIMEDFVAQEIEKACAAIEKEKDAAILNNNGTVNNDNICTCVQCRLDAACYVLNRVPCSYILSSRGLMREDKFTLEKQQRVADITTLVYEALKQIGHNKRAYFDHDQKEAVHREGAFYNFPAMVGRIFDGDNFEPLQDATITLFLDGKEAAIKDANWPNPCFLISKTEGTYTFWPAGIKAKKAGVKKTFNVTIEATAPKMEKLQHRFQIPAISEETENTVFSMANRFKITDLYMFAETSCVSEIEGE
ncbi:MAG: late competence development ComFB family protein [Termitinemataceae bacterium]|nr:MAG: late competence development ComFB family protein [Termitinemataceae bacterium]